MLKKSTDPDSTALLKHDLGVLSSSRQRVRALLMLGFSYDEIATAVGVSGQAIRGWADGETAPNTTNRDRLDQFRALALLLCEELDASVVRPFFCSRPAPDHEPPLNYVLRDPQAVGAAAMAQISYQEELRDGGLDRESADDISPSVQKLLARARREVPVTFEPEARDEPEPAALADEAHTELVYERRSRLTLPFVSDR